MITCTSGAMFRSHIDDYKLTLEIIVILDFALNEGPINKSSQKMRNV